MRKHQQRQILELLQTMKKAQTAGLYADCQECALSIGEFIEGIEGEGTQTVTLLEEYCELVYKASIGEIGEKPLRKHMIKIENSIKNEMKPNRIEMVFLSYKASMSDCLESIYTAAKEDPQTDTYWIPIPYYDCKPDGSFGEMHFEGADYYKPTIECTDWREYDIEERHPDVVFTFSPYDNLGKMTSIHPDYYCERLRCLTDMLVYVPYFVTLDKIGEPYTKCPGVMFSHLVIVQSEIIRQIYIRNYKELEKIGYSRDIYGAPEDKIVALGSPKFDAVINAKPEDFSLPEAWCKLIELADGTKKKIILLNTSITPSLNASEQYLKKLHFVIETFHEHRDDVILWWRPHPLGRTAFESMSPELLTEYDKIVADYLQEDWGIYDDTTDLHRAITLTDAYYGDWSSLVPLYLITGKPIMINNHSILESTLQFSPTSIYITEDKLWFSIRNINALISMDRNTLEPELVGSFPGERSNISKYNDSLYRTPVEINDVFYFPPLLANEITEYSPQTNTYTKIQYKAKVKTGIQSLNLHTAVAYMDYVFFTPYYYPAIVRLNTKTKEITHHSNWLKPLNILADTELEGFFGIPIVVESSIWLSLRGANAIMEFNMETLEHTFHVIGEKEYRYITIYHDGVYFWLSPLYNTQTPVVKWCPETGVVKEFPDIYTDNPDIRFFPLLFCNGYLWLLPIFGDSLIKIDTRNDAVSIAHELELYLKDNKMNQIQQKCVCAQTFGDTIYAFLAHTGTLIEYDCANSVCKATAIKYTAESLSRLDHMFEFVLLQDTEEIKNAYDCLYNEASSVPLDTYLTHLLKGNNISEPALHDYRRRVATMLAENTDGSTGQSILSYVKKRVFY